MSFVARVLHRDDVLLLVSYRDLFVQCWTGAGTAEHVRKMIDVHRRFVDEHGRQATIALSHITSRGISPPDEATRALLPEHSRVVRGVRASATVIEADGFGAAMIRSIVSGLMLLGERETAHQVFSTPRAGLQFLSKHRDPAAGAMPLDEVDGAYARVRAGATSA